MCLVSFVDIVIVAAVDRSEKAKRVVSEAEIVARAFDEPVHVIHVLSRSEFIDLGMTRADEGDSISMDEVREAAADIAANVAANIDVATEVIGLMGDPAPTVVDYATDNDARYIVVAGRKRSPAGKMIFGSVAQSILLNAESPVISTISQSE